MIKKIFLTFLLCCGSTLFSVPALADFPEPALNYQGRVSVGDVVFDGTGQFKFALVNAAGDQTYWSNDGTSVGGSEPAASVELAVVRGLYSVRLGDTGVANMIALAA